MVTPELKWSIDPSFIPEVKTSLTTGSLVDIDRSVELAKEAGLSHVLCADLEHTKNWFALSHACEKLQIKPLFGVRFRLVSPLENDRSRVTAVVATEEGWQSLMGLVAIAQDRWVDARDVVENQAGLVFIANEFSYPDLGYGIDTDRLYFGVRPGQIDQDLTEAGQYEKVRVVATSEVWHENDNDWDWYLSVILRALAAGERLDVQMLINDELPETYATDFIEPGFMQKLPLPLKHRRLRQDTATFLAKIKVKKLPKPDLSVFPVPVGETPDTWLRFLVNTSLPDRYAWQVPESVKERVDEELDRIKEEKKASTTLHAHQIALQANQLEALVMNIGSSSHSETNNVLKISNIPATEYRLYFDRYLGPQTTKEVDTDWWVQASKQKELIAAVTKTIEAMGQHVAHIVVWPTYGVKSAIPAVMRVFGVPSDIQKAVTQRVVSLLTVEKMGVAKVIEDLKRDKRYGPVVAYMVSLGLHLASLSIPDGTDRRHASKIVILPHLQQPGLMFEWRVNSEGREYLVALMDKRWAEYFINFDFVSSWGLELIDQVSKTVGVNIEDLRVTSEIVADIFENPVGIPYLGTPFLREVLARYAKAAKHVLGVDDFFKALSLSRPAARQSFFTFLERMAQRYSGKKWGGDILGETLGLILYQEQVMRLAKEAAGLKDEEVLELRRGMSKERTGKQFETLRERFLAGIEAHGVSRSGAEFLYQMMAGFEEYGFVKGHVVSIILNLCLPAAILRYDYPEVYFAMVKEFNRDVYLHIKRRPHFADLERWWWEMQREKGRFYGR